MARNEEKAQSMLYRFREAKAAELGIATKSDKRPRMASSCKSLRECERWRGEILREISRKVSKIQDMGLTDYEIRDLNDEINKLMREKRHWENQIVALGGANYRRNIAMLDADGKEVPGTKGYKYFGRAKELPGVKELFEKSTQPDEENQAQQHYRKFQHQGPSYYGDLDETDETLLASELAAEEEEWAEAYRTLATALNIPQDDLQAPPIPRPVPTPLSATSAPHDIIPPSTSSAEKRGAPSPTPVDTEMADETTSSKRQKTESDGASAVVTKPKIVSLPPLLSVLDPSDVTPPTLPTKEEMEDVLLALRKKALLEEYLGEGDAK